MNKPKIVPLSADDIPAYAEVIRQSFATVARDFNLTQENCPLHPAFITHDNLRGTYDNNYSPFGLFAGETLAGFVSLSDKGNGVFAMNSLSVLPEFRHYGYGKTLMDFCKAQVKKRGGLKMEIDLIDENTVLKNWYFANGFTLAETKRLPWFPQFTVAYMEWKI
jgi:ribosomal protein S18 acetylase RimI-like enzyme